MEVLQITEQEALQILEDDKKIDRGGKLFEQTPEQKKNSKKARGNGQPKKVPTVYTFDTTKRKKKENLTKQSLITDIKNLLEEKGISDIEVTNIERQIDFKVDNVRYRIVLSSPKK